MPAHTENEGSNKNNDNNNNMELHFHSLSSWKAVLVQLASIILCIYPYMWSIFYYYYIRCSNSGSQWRHVPKVEMYNFFEALSTDNKFQPEQAIILFLFQSTYTTIYLHHSLLLLPLSSRPHRTPLFSISFAFFCAFGSYFSSY